MRRHRRNICGDIRKIATVTDRSSFFKGKKGGRIYDLLYSFQQKIKIRIKTKTKIKIKITLGFSVFMGAKPELRLSDNYAEYLSNNYLCKRSS